MKRVKLKKSIYDPSDKYTGLQPGCVWSGSCKTTNGNAIPTKVEQRDMIARQVKDFKSKANGKKRRLAQSFNATRARLIEQHMRRVARGRSTSHQVPTK